MQETQVQFLSQEDPRRRDRLPTPVFLGFPYGSADKQSACNEGDLGSIPGLGRSPGEGKGYPLQYSGLENSMECIVQGVTKSQIRLSNFHFHLSFRYLLPRVKQYLSAATASELFLTRVISALPDDFGAEPFLK